MRNIKYYSKNSNPNKSKKYSFFKKNSIIVVLESQNCLKPYLDLIHIFAVFGL